MSQDISVRVNDNEVEIKNKDIRRLLAVLLTVDNPLSDTIQYAISQKAVPANAPEGTPPAVLKDFYPAQFFEGKNPGDTFEVEIKSGDSTLTGSASRQVMFNRMILASNIADYKTEIIRDEPKGAKKSAKSAESKPAADNV